MIIPRVGIFDFPDNIICFEAFLDTKIESSVSRNDFSIVIGTNVADLDVSSSILARSFNFSSSIELFQFPSSNNTGDITCFIDVGESILEIGKSRDSSIITSISDNGKIRIIFSKSTGIILMAIGVGENKLCASFF